MIRTSSWFYLSPHPQNHHLIRTIALSSPQVDRCYGWKSTPNGAIRDSLANQDENCRMEFKDRTTQTITALMEQGKTYVLFSSFFLFCLLRLLVFIEVVCLCSVY